MSQRYYIKKWDLAQIELNYIINSERPEKPEPLSKTLREAFDRVTIRYVQYIRIYKRLAKCYDYMVHPQKRILIGKCIEGVVGRIVELRYELLRIRVNEYPGFGPFCVEYRILPSELEMELSRTFSYEKNMRLHRRIALLQYILTSLGKTDEEVISAPVSKPPVPEIIHTASDEDSAVNRSDSQEEQFRKTQQSRKNISWKKVQLMFKLYKVKSALENVREVIDRELGMKSPEEEVDIEDKERKVLTKRIVQAHRNQDEYVQRVIVKTELLKESAEARNFEEDLKRNIRQWILECHDATGAFPDYPDDEAGGSALIFANKTVQEVQEELEDAADPKSKPKPKDKSKEKAKQQKSSRKPEPPQGFVMMSSNFVEEVLVEACNEYEMFWRNKDDSKNFKQELCPNLLDEQIHNTVEEALRQQIDEQMRRELETLTYAVDKLRMAKAKPKKRKPAKKKKQKDKKKKLKDLTPNADVEDLYSELVRNEIVKRVRNFYLKDFLGEMNLMTEEENNGEECFADLGDIRKMIFDFIVLPLSSKSVHEHAPFSKSLLIVGPRGSGKKMLVHAVCNELGANLFDLTAENIAGKYTDAEGQQMLMHLVMKVGKLLEPSIIMIDNCELMFTKKLPPEITSSPGRMKSNLIKGMKTIGPEDRIMLVGLTARPYRAAKKPLLKMYERVIFINTPAYASRYRIWETGIKLRGGYLNRNLQISTLALVSRNYTARDITQATNEVMSVKRVERQNIRSLRTNEFGDRISQFMPVYVEELQTLVDWFKELPQTKKRESIKALETAGQNVFGMV